MFFIPIYSSPVVILQTIGLIPLQRSISVFCFKSTKVFFWRFWKSHKFPKPVITLRSTWKCPRGSIKTHTGHFLHRRKRTWPQCNSWQTNRQTPGHGLQHFIWTKPLLQLLKHGGAPVYFSFFLGRRLLVWPHFFLRQLTARGCRRA